MGRGGPTSRKWARRGGTRERPLRGERRLGLRELRSPRHQERATAGRPGSAPNGYKAVACRGWVFGRGRDFRTGPAGRLGSRNWLCRPAMRVISFTSFGLPAHFLPRRAARQRAVFPGGPSRAQPGGGRPANPRTGGRQGGGWLGSSLLRRFCRFALPQRAPARGTSGGNEGPGNSTGTLEKPW